MSVSSLELSVGLDIMMQRRNGSVHSAMVNKLIIVKMIAFYKLYKLNCVCK